MSMFPGKKSPLSATAAPAVPKMAPATEKPLSHRGATIAQEIEQLEESLAACQRVAMENDKRALVAEALVEELRKEYNHRASDDARELSRTRDERDKFQAQVFDAKAETLEFRTRLEIVATQILEVLRPPKEPAPAPAAPIRPEPNLEAELKLLAQENIHHEDN